VVRPRPACRPAFQPALDTLLGTGRSLPGPCRRALPPAGLGAAAPVALAGRVSTCDGRASDISQARPELGHATNAAAFIGRREMSRGLFLDRRVFLISYDPTTDADGPDRREHPARRRPGRRRHCARILFFDCR
jgi:hypothetical protein